MSQPDTSTWPGFVERLYRQNEFAIKLGLESMTQALAREDFPHRHHARILVAGTNGKGGTAAALSSILTAHGFRVGLYTSPHILDLCERFRVDGQPMDRPTIHRIGQDVLENYGEPDDDNTPRLTFFELTTLIATLAFKEADVDVAVYEVGLGGRLDATNALEPQLCVITSIGLDHQAYLGDDIRSIAREKAGIIRRDAPLVIGRQPYAAALQELTDRAPTRTHVYGVDFRDSDAGVEVNASGERLFVDAPATTSPYTRRWNDTCAVAASSLWLGEHFLPARAAEGLARTRWPGRMQVWTEEFLRGGPIRYLFDAAHNPQGAERLFEHLASQQIEIGAVVFGAMRDKHLAGITAPIPADLPVFATRISSPRAASGEQLTEALAGKNLRAVSASAKSLRLARSQVSGDQVLLVFGSVYLIGELFSQLGIRVGELRTYVDPRDG